MTNRRFKSGVSREQASLLPPRVYVGLDNPAIESYVAALDLAELGFRHAERGVGVGQPPYAPADLYLYGDLNQVRSSRRLEQEARRNLELIWLLKGLRPGYRTIAKFRQENWAALKAANRSFVLLVRELGLESEALLAIDGVFFHGDASKASLVIRAKPSRSQEGRGQRCLRNERARWCNREERFNDLRDESHLHRARRIWWAGALRASQSRGTGGRNRKCGEVRGAYKTEKGDLCTENASSSYVVAPASAL